MLGIHPDAVRRFNERAGEIARIVASEIVCGAEPAKDCVESHMEVDSSSFRPDIHVASSISEKDIIGTPRVGKADFWGKTIAYSFRHSGTECWIEGSTYSEVVRLSELVQKTKSVRELISQETIEKCLCDWIEKQVCGDTLTEFIDTLNEAAKTKVKDIQLRVPIEQMYVERSFDFGRLRIASTTRVEIDEWTATTLEKTDEHKDRLVAFFDSNIRPIQGFAFAAMELRAEPRRAKEVLLKEAERAVSIFRVFSGASLHPRAVSGAVLWGKALQDKTFVLVISDSQLSEVLTSLEGVPLVPIQISSAKLQEWKQLGLDSYDRLLQLSKMTEYERKVLDATLLYSKCTVVKSVAEKFTYIFSALESVLIRNNTESIQSNLADRMAFALESTPQKRKEVIGAVKSAYGLRSRYLHHGVSIDDLKQAEVFMVLAWRTILWLGSTTSKFQTVEEMFMELEHRKLS